MSHKIGRFLSKSIFTKIFFVILSLISFFFSLYQLNHQYDGLHHGIVFSISQDFLNGKIPFKEFLPEYGIFFIFINAIFIKIFFNSIYGTYFLIALSKGFTFLFFGLILKNIFNNKVAVSITTIMFLAHPFVDTPFPDYIFFLLIIISFHILIISKNNFLFFLSGFIYSLAGLNKENFILILFFSILLFYACLCFLKFIRKKKIYNNFINIYWIIGYITPLILFFLYLNYNSVLVEYLDQFSTGKIILETICTSTTDIIFLKTLDCGWIAIKSLFYNSITKFFTEPYWLFFLIIIIANICFIINVMFFEKKYFIDETKKLMIWVSLMSLLLFSANLYYLTIQRLFTGVGIGIIVVVYLIQNLKSPSTKYFLHCLFFVFLINGMQFARTTNNPIYPTFVEKKHNYKEDIKFLKFKKMSDEEWLQLNDFVFTSNLVKKNCPFINYSTNLTNDVYYRIILKENFELLNFTPYDGKNSFTEKWSKKYDPLFDKNLKNEIIKKNILIAIDDTNKLNKKLKNNSKLYLFKSIKYNNYGSKFINIYLPNNCKTLS